MNSKVRQKQSFFHFGRLCRRVTALTLVLTMLLPTAAFSFDSMGKPEAVTDSKELPTITVEANAVVDRWFDPTGPESAADYLTGYLEVAIRVKSGVKDGTVQAFNTVSLALHYSPLLTPYDWTVQKGWSEAEPPKDTNGNEIVKPVDLTGKGASFANSDMATMQVLKNNQVGTAIGHVSGKNDKGGLLYIAVNADRPVTLEEDTVVAVVRFKYDLRDEAHPDGILPMAKPATEIAQWVDPGSDKCLIRLATPDELGRNYIQPEVYYASSTNGMFYSADPARYLEVSKGGTTVKDGTNMIPLNTVYDGVIKPNNINFTLVNKTTYNDGGLTLDDLATVLFYDWDDTLIGVLIVPRDGDARKLVNDYVRENLIHPDLRAAAVDSLARKDNYRGKYPSTPMVETGTDATMDSGRTDGLVGSDYPLTNKLDYVFMQRPMEKVTTDVNGDPVTTNTWRQRGTDTTAEWDENYPFIYGWARLTDDNWNNPGSMWTTLGLGELAECTGLVDGAISGAVGAAPFQLTSEDETFSFVDFDFRKNPLEPGGVCSVKAMYEPGNSLLTSGYAYQMISEPYYNKMNPPAAISGGAYSVDVIFERSNLDNQGILCGVARARDLALRQEITSDLKWESEYLENANIAQQSAKTKTTYSTVPVDNVDEVNIQLVLSGRNNKVDYYLMDAYGASFVTGGERSRSNNSFTGTAHVIDNYNYNTSDNITDRTYYRAEYVDTDGDNVVNDDRSGTYGFVLSCTLNNLAQKATEYINGKIDRGGFNSYFTFGQTGTYTDINLRIDNNPISARYSDAVGLAWQAIAYTAQAAHKGIDGYSTANDEWWDVEHNYAQVTYHQVQLFISAYVAKYGSETTLGTDAAHMADYRAWLKDAASADAETISWCNLHEECAASRSGKPTSFEKMVRVALGQKLPAGVTDPRDVIALLTMAEAEAMSHLRTDKQGNAFADINALADAFVTAVQEVNKHTPIDPSVLVPASDGSKSDAYWKVWDSIQGYILSDPKPTDKAGVEKAAQLSQNTAWWNEGESAPSAGSLANLVAAEQKAVETGRDAWINYYRYQDAFADMKKNGVSPQAQWTRITENLVKDINGTPYATYDEFKTAFRAAVAALGAPDPDNPDQYYWYKLQYHMAGDTRPADVSTYNTYWWHNGYSKINDLASLLLGAQRATSGGETIWAMFSLDDLYDEDLKELHFRSGFNGTTDKYADGTATDLADFKAGVIEFVGKKGALIVDADSQEYEKTNAWNQLQYYLIHRKDSGGCDLTADSTYAGMDREIGYYWWRRGAAGEDYTALNPGIDTANLKTLMEATYRHAVNGNPQAYVKLDVSAADKFRLIDSYDKDAKPANWDALDRYQDATVSGLYTKLDNLVKAAITAGDDYNTLTWRQIQHYLLGKGYVTKADLAADDTKIPSDLKTDADGYWWKEGTENPGTAVGPIKTTWDEFVDCLVEYMNSDMGTAAVDTINGKVDEYFIASKLNMRGLGTKNAVKLYASLTDTQKNTVKTTVRTLAYNLKNTQGVSDANGVNGLIDWYVVQYYLVQTTAAKKITTTTNPLVTKAVAKTFCDGKGYAPPAGSIPDDTRSVLNMQANLLLEPAEELPEETVDPGQVDTVITTAETVLPDGTRLEIKTYTRIDPDTGETVTRTVVTHWAADGTLLSETVTDPEAPVESPEPTEPEEPVCTCGSEDGIHGSDCPLYVAPEEPVCTCGSEDGTHTEDCPLYVAPEEPACTCGSEDGTHAEDCPLYVAPEEPACTCGSEDGTHTEDCPLYVAPEEPACTCGSEDGTHAEDCPLYVAPEEPVCTCGSEDGAHAEGCPLYTQPEEPTTPETPTDPVPPDEELTDPEVPGGETPVPISEPEPEPEPDPAPAPDPEPETTETDTSDPEPSGELSARKSKRLSLRLIALTNRFFDSGGWNMNGITTQKNISPPGQWMARAPWLWTMTERRGLA